MILYVCAEGTKWGSLPGPIAHPRGRAAKALNDAGHGYEINKVKGGTAKV